MYKEGGSEKLIRRYKELRTKEKEQCLFEVRTLYYFANFFHYNGKEDESFKLHIANEEEFHDSYGTWYWLGNAYFTMGQKKKH